MLVILLKPATYFKFYQHPCFRVLHQNLVMEELFSATSLV